ncbi:hypothetical protein GGD50_005452 [Rhizobium paranaense]|uniref:Uncharacterized protein n=1 Tax=Rhizobium paranaense TaxID=1650438 RepID=A0A7W8XWD6_9HYPH|nr:hypothetical protein [Rhizobium paranaense]
MKMGKTDIPMLHSGYRFDMALLANPVIPFLDPVIALVESDR